MSEKISVFPSDEVEAQFNAAYAAALGMWPVPYEELSIPTRFGYTHVIASGPKQAAPLVLFQPTGAGEASGTVTRIPSAGISGYMPSIPSVR